MRDFDSMNFFQIFSDAYMIEQFEEEYREFNRKSLQTNSKNAREWYDNIAKGFKKNENPDKEWKRDFLDAWSLIRYYREWLEENGYPSLIEYRLANGSVNKCKVCYREVA